MGFWKAFIPLAMTSASTAANVYGARAQNEANQDAANAQMAHQIAFYQNRYQWQMEDMRKAGLNPILSYKQSAPGGGAGASYQAVNVGEAGSRGAASAVQMHQAIQNANLLKEQQNTQKMQQVVAAEQANQIRVNTEVAKENVWSARAEAARNRSLEEFWNTEGGSRTARIGAVNQAIPGSGWVAMAKALGVSVNELVDEFFDSRPSINSAFNKRRKYNINPRTFLSKSEIKRIGDLWKRSGSRRSKYGLSDGSRPTEAQIREFLGKSRKYHVLPSPR